MGASLTALAVTAFAVALTAMAGAGPETRAHDPRELRGRRRAGRDHQAQDRELRLPDIRHPRPRHPRLSLRGRATRHGRVLRPRSDPEGGSFLDIRGRVSSGRRARASSRSPSIPSCPRNHRVYAFYTNRGQEDLEMDEFRAPLQPARAARSSRRRVIVIAHPGAANHNGGQLAFGPDGVPVCRDRRRRKEQETPERTPRTSASSWASCCGSTPTSTERQRYRVPPRGNPYVGATGSRRDLRARPAEPVQILLRQGADLDRRRRAGATSRRSTPRAHRSASRRQFRLGPLRGGPSLRRSGRQRGAPAEAASYRPPIFEYSHWVGSAVARSSAAYVVRSHEAGQPQGPLPVHGPLREGGLRSFVTAPQPRQEPTAPSVSTSRSPAHSGKAPRGSIFVASLSGPVYQAGSQVELPDILAPPGRRRSRVRKRWKARPPA